jgi:hypothetical protein
MREGKDGGKGMTIGRRAVVVGLEAAQKAEGHDNRSGSGCWAGSGGEGKTGRQGWAGMEGMDQWSSGPAAGLPFDCLLPGGR